MDLTGLIVSSNIVLNKRIDVMLTVEGFTCLPVYSRDEILNIFMKHRFDFIIMDITAGNTDFLDVLPDIRTMNRSIPILVIDKIDEPIQFDEELQVYRISKIYIDEQLPQKIKSIIGGGNSPTT